jgi:hypothetical protein
MPLLNGAGEDGFCGAGYKKWHAYGVGEIGWACTPKICAFQFFNLNFITCSDWESLIY